MVVTIFNEYRHEREDAACAAIYPDGIHRCIANFLQADDIEIQLAEMDMPENGLPAEVLDRTDVLIWWGHAYHHLVSWDVVDRIQNRVLRGMGFVALHSAHASRPFTRIVGTSGSLSWGDDVYERIFTCNPAHPVAAGVPNHFELGIEEMYSEPFDLPQPNEVVFSSWFANGYLLRSGVAFQRGLGKIFYFQPGHETCRSYHHPMVQHIIRNAVRYVAPTQILDTIEFPQVPNLEPDPSLL